MAFLNLPQRTPIFYGWIIFSLAASMSLVRPVVAVATLSMFFVPMSNEFGWSRGLISGAVSLGGIAGALISPLVGRMLDRWGAGLILTGSSIIVAVCVFQLAGTNGITTFYVFYILGRMTFASPFELAPATVISNWFIRKRAFTLAVLQVTQGIGLAVIPILAQWIISGWGWRTSWTSLGVMVLIIGVLPPILFVIRRPEDVGLLPDGDKTMVPGSTQEGLMPQRPREDNFTLRGALHTRSMWLIMGFSALIFLVQAGISLHQAPYYIHKGLSPGEASTIVAAFALASAGGGLLWTAFFARMPVRIAVGTAGAAMCSGVLLVLWADSLIMGQIAAIVFGSGLGGVVVLLRLIWADYYGRDNLGTIRGVALPIQVCGQAAGPIIGGALFDLTGSYTLPFRIFFVAGLLSLGFILAARPPRFSETDSRDTTDGVKEI